MKFTLKPSLEQIAVVKIGILLWNQNDVRSLISKLSYADRHLRNWNKIEERVTKKVPQLLIPQPLKEKVIGVIKPIGMQIFEWIQYYHTYDKWIENQTGENQLTRIENQLCLELPAHIPAELSWTPQGTLDRKRTAEMLVRDDTLNVSRRYILACDYFLEDDITRFWNRLPEDFKEHHWHNFPVISFWSNNMKRGVGPISFKHIFYSSVQNNNKAAAKYFLQKLTPKEREECLKEFAIYVKDADVLCFLLPEMKEEKLREVIKKNPYWVLHCFLQWPWQSFFIGVANCMWDFLSKINYHDILADIILKVMQGYRDYNYQKLFREFWQKSPSALKDWLIEGIDKSFLLYCLFNIKDKENIRLILEHATLTAKAKLIYSQKINDYLTFFIFRNEWDFLEFFIRECLPSKSEMLKFKKKFEKRRNFKQCSAADKHQWNQLFSFSDDSICKYDKRNLEEDESSLSKRFQSLCIYMCPKTFFCSKHCPNF